MSLEESIKKTIKYAKKYNYQLTFGELIKRLISKKKYSDLKIREFLNKNDKYQRQLKLENENFWTKNKVEKTKKLAILIEKRFKSILFLGITGSVAANNSKKNDDIDLILITKKDSLWGVRLKLRWFVFINKIAHRKYGAKQKKDEFCFNIWLDERGIKLPKIKRNLRSAVDMILVRPIINKNKTYEKFLLANGWAKEWVATGYCKKIKPSVPRRAQDISMPAGRHGLKKGDSFRYCLNFLVFMPQYLWMLPKIKKEQVNLRQAFFHRN